VKLEQKMRACKSNEREGEVGREAAEELFASVVRAVVLSRSRSSSSSSSGDEEEDGEEKELSIKDRNTVREEEGGGGREFHSS
jgi:hypothetical protein